jgi:hypothetical protein
MANVSGFPSQNTRMAFRQWSRSIGETAWSSDQHALISTVAPAEPHEFGAMLKLMAGIEVDDLPFRMEEPEGHHH